jgi:predicted ArsR family transcriptional regulator
MRGLDVVAHPIRARILGFLGQRDSASLPELAEAAGVHRNTVRPHIAALEDAGVLETANDAPRGRGRPRRHFRLRAEWSSPTADFRGLAELLAAALALAQVDADRLDELGREWGRFLLGRPGGGRADHEIPRALGRLGFSVEVRDGAVQLRSCPCPLVSPPRPELVCRLATAAVDGVLAGAGDARCVAGATHDPDRRRCSVRLDGRRQPG